MANAGRTASKLRSQSVATAIGVAFAAGPTVMGVMKIIQAISAPHAPLWSTTDIAGFAFSPFVGLVGGIPAAVIGVVSADIFVRKNMDSVWIAALAGVVIGAIIATPLLIMLPAWDAIYIGTAFEIAAIFMSIAFWALAIRPYRRSRMALRDQEAIRATE